MSREEFLRVFQETLVGKVSNQIIHENLNYYSNYFNEQIRNGKSEAEIINMLGDPRLLAKTIEDSSNFAADEAKTRDFNTKKTTSEQNYYGENKIKKIKLPGWAIAAIIIAVIVVIMMIVFKVIAFFMPLIITVFVAGFIYKFIRNMFRRN